MCVEKASSEIMNSKNFGIAKSLKEKFGVIYLQKTALVCAARREEGEASRRLSPSRSLKGQGGERK